MTSPTELSLERKLKLFETATAFKIGDTRGSDGIFITWRGATDEENADRWAITRMGECYNRNKDSWEYEPSPSSRDDDFIQRTRYSLLEAVNIVDSPGFAGKYLQSHSE